MTGMVNWHCMGPCDPVGEGESHWKEEEEEEEEEKEEEEVLYWTTF